MTEREILDFERCAFEKLVGELEARVALRLGVAYTHRDRKRDRLRLALAREVLQDREARLVAMDARARRKAVNAPTSRQLKATNGAWRRVA